MNETGQFQAGPLTLRKLLSRSELRAEIEGDADARVCAVTDDSRLVTPGSCFVGVRGTGKDGREFIPAAIRAGATVVVGERPVDVPGGVTAAYVADAREAVARLAAGSHLGGIGEKTNLRLVGVTGTNGKSTVAWMLRSILRSAGEVPAMLGTIEYDLVTERRKASLTTPGALEICQNLALSRLRGATAAVMEVSSHALDQRRCDGLRYAAGVFTNLSGDHLDYHETMEAYFAAKARLFELMTPRGIAVINVDDEMGARLAKSLPGRVLTFGIQDARADVRGEVRSMTRGGTVFVMHAPSEVSEIRLPVVGLHNVSNALAAAAAAAALEIGAARIRTGLEAVTHVPGRLQRVEPDGCPFSVLVDYAHTDAALDNVLRAVRPITEGRLICVFGCGGNRDRTKRPRMAAAVERLADLAVVTSDNPRHEEPDAIIGEIVGGFAGRAGCRIEIEPDRRRAIRAAISEARSGDTVLIAGKGHEDYQIVGDRVLPFDDAAVAREFVGALAPTKCEQFGVPRDSELLSPNPTLDRQDRRQVLTAEIPA